jgi:hypothetical protein
LSPYPNADADAQTTIFSDEKISMPKTLPGLKGKPYFWLQKRSSLGWL